MHLVLLEITLKGGRCHIWFKVTLTVTAVCDTVTPYGSRTFYGSEVKPRAWRMLVVISRWFRAVNKAELN